jgi:hypothetical protein
MHTHTHTFSHTHTHTFSPTHFHTCTQTHSNTHTHTHSVFRIFDVRYEEHIFVEASKKTLTKGYNLIVNVSSFTTVNIYSIFFIKLTFLLFENPSRYIVNKMVLI